MSALSDALGAASEDPRLEFFRCQYLVEIIDRLTYGEVAVYQHRRDLQRYAGGPSPKSKPLGKEYP